MQPQLSVNNLTVKVEQASDETVILNRVNLDVQKGSITALVGASGSGKTTAGYSILQLLSSGLKVTQGEIIYEGKDVLKLDESQMRQVRGKEIGMVFQEPLSAFNPVFTIGYQIDEMMQFHTDLSKEKRHKRMLELLDIVGLPEPDRMSKAFPHQLSGGMRQRAMIAQAIAVDPKLIIADEPTSSLDVTLQARIIELFRKLNKELDLSILLITHDLDMVSHMCDYTFVLNKGEVVEHGLSRDIAQNPQHDYTKKLINALKV